MEPFTGPILIVEDEPAPREFLADAVKEKGWKVNTASDGAEAWEILQKGYYPVLILDWNLPGPSGLELCRRVRLLSRYNDSVILMITGQDMEGRLEEAMAVGADDYLSKPIPLHMLRIRLAIAESRVHEKRMRLQAEEALKSVNQGLEGRVKRRTEELEKSQQIYKSIMDNLNVGILFLDTNQRILQSNPQIHSWFPKTATGDGLHCYEVFHDKQVACDDCPTKVTLESGRTCEKIFNRQVGEEMRDLRVLTCPVRNASGETDHVVQLVEDVTERLQEEHNLRDRLEEAERLAQAKGRSQLEGLVGASTAMNHVYSQVISLAKSSQTVLLHGETGTGKEVTARALHNLSPWRDQPFVSVNCGSLPEAILESELFGHTKGAFTGATADKGGLFSAAGNGTIFLDEIEAASLRTQISLLRVLDQKEILPVGGREPHAMEARVVVATNQDLEALIAQGAFREDLYFRVCAETIELPPLRERTDDLGLLSECFLKEATGERQTRHLSTRALGALAKHPWPGNVREFRNLMHSLARTAPKPTIRPADLPEAFRLSDSQAMPTLAKLEKDLLVQSLAASQGNKADAARLMGVSRNTVYSLMKKHDVTW
ncbi:MAG: sigma 54-interacting transcriptional regulator [Planctomycetota bacterium]|jgi:PAS domain S-box-containing protein